MREIKFRAWDRFKKKMYSFEELDEKDMYNDINFYSLLKGEYSEVKAHQYTGLTDKNGVEIYEGDILKTPTEKVGQVFFHANGGWLVETKEYEFNLVKITATKQSEVIGNIYEHPQLLEVSTG